MIRSASRLALAVLAALAVGAPPPASAQTARDVRLKVGNTGKTLRGKVAGEAYLDYRIEGEAGQELLVEMTITDTDGAGSAYFNILPPGGGMALHNGSVAGNAAAVLLHYSGPYTVRVYLMGNDRDSGRMAEFTLDLAIN